MKKLVRESINEDTNVYGKPWVTDITWETEDEEGNPIESPKEDPHIPIAPVPPSPRKLPIITIYNEQFYIDSKLKQLRNVENPYFYFDLDESQLTGLLNMRSRLIFNDDYYNFTHDDTIINKTLNLLFDEIKDAIEGEPEGEPELPKESITYTEDGYPIKLVKNDYTHMGYTKKAYPKGYKLMKILEFIKQKGKVKYGDIQKFAYDLSYGEGMFNKNKFDNRGYYSTIIQKLVTGVTDAYYYPGIYRRHSERINREPFISKNEDKTYSITGFGDSKIYELKDYLKKYKI